MCRRRLTVLVPLLAVLAATVLAAAPASAGGGGCHRPATEGSGDTLALTELCFSPTVLRVAPGSEVTIVNRDTISHPLSRPGGEWAWDGPIGDRTTVRLERAGTYPFFCYVHPGMVGVVVVGDGRGTGSAVVEVAATGTGTGTGAGTAPGGAAATPAEPAAAAGGPGPFPTAWLVLVAVAALVGAAAGTRLAAGRPRS
jgi:plastocyanin